MAWDAGVDRAGIVAGVSSAAFPFLGKQVELQRVGTPMVSQSFRSNTGSMIGSRNSFQLISDDEEEAAEEQQQPKIAASNATRREHSGPRKSFLRRASKGSRSAVARCAPEAPASPSRSRTTPRRTTPKEQRGIMKIENAALPSSPKRSSPPPKTKKLPSSLLPKRGGAVGANRTVSPDAAARSGSPGLLLEGGMSNEEDDPVMALFRSRQTQRVRFHLETEPKERTIKTAATMSPATIIEKPDQQQPSSANTPAAGGTGKFNVSQFMKGALFSKSRSADYEEEFAKQVEETKEEMDSWSHVVGSESVLQASPTGTVSVFQESPEVKASVLKLLNKSRRAQFLHYRYPYAVKCCVRAVDILRRHSYPDDHALVAKAVKSLQSAHFAESAYNNSANIVKLGIKYEDSGDLVRALKMYTIAYRIRRDSLSGSHPSLVVLLNMLGSIQIKRDQWDEAMAIFELALKDTTPPLTPTNGLSDDSNENLVFPTNYLTRAVTYREMGTIYEKRGDSQEALRMYHKSLDCMAEYKGVVFRQTQNEDTSHDNINWEETSLLARFHEDFGSHSEDHADQSGMELTFDQKEKKGVESMSDYDVFFPAEEVKKRRNSNKKTAAEGTEKRGKCTDVDAALTLHRIAQLHRSNGEHQKALEAFHVSLRGMKFALGKSHPNVAAVLGNIGNLQKEMGDMDAAYSTYQQVLAIESYRLGLSHPDVVVTLHNIATIDASRGNHEHSLSLYTQVINLQRKLFGEDHESVAVTSACMGDVYERLGDIKSAVDAYEEALRIKIVSLGRHSLEVARILHKLGKLAISDDDYHLAHSYISKASLVYKLNKLGDDEPWVVDIRRDCADVDAAIAMGRGVDFFEC